MRLLLADLLAAYENLHDIKFPIQYCQVRGEAYLDCVDQLWDILKQYVQ